ncbi:hypothetical protein GR158_24255 [Shinella sp. AETb1-6]|uniref:DNA methyltransferase n=1 Tax=Shinella sp. AETb1-6 TaxID=2692210 RepID=UPI00136BA72E|nr:DNA methyltransferase [Shinella sp. AETb1-6]MXN54217.1 hypothetical protein [Shinella sp. AETb1-6]
MASHTVLGDKVRIYQRANSKLWQASTYLDGKEWRVSTKTDSLSLAKEFAEDWYLELRGKSRAGLLKVERTFADAAKQFVMEYVALTNGERNPRYVKDHEARLENHLIPYFGKTGLSAVTAGMVQQYRVMRSQPHPETGKVPTRSTLHHETVTLRQVMKTALRHNWISHLPDFSAPYKASGNKLHPTQKPVEVLEPLVRTYCPEGGLVLDPFCGSGSTLVAARSCGRRYLGIELDGAYAAAATERLGSQRSGETIS